jgi:fucose permease
MAGWFLLGMYTALLGALLEPWFLKFGMGNERAGNCFLALNVGIFLGLALWGRLASSGDRTVGAGFGVAGALSALSLAALAWFGEGRWILAALVGLGIGAGLLARTSARLFCHMLTPGRAGTMLNLAGLSLGAGAVAACLLVWLALHHLSTLLTAIAVLSSLFAVSAARGRLFRLGPSLAFGFRVDWRGMAHPITFLLSFALLAQAAAHWSLAGWLPLYLTRKWGATASIALGTLTLYWIAHSSARVAASRLPPLEERVRSLVIATAVSLLGATFLLRGSDLSGIIAGTLLLGAGSGVLYFLTTRLITRRYPSYHPDLVSAHLMLYLGGGLLAPWLIGPLASEFGVDSVLWLVLGAATLVFLLLTVFFVEAWLSSQTVALE